jgi:hypothetical protein
VYAAAYQPYLLAKLSIHYWCRESLCRYQSRAEAQETVDLGSMNNIYAMVVQKRAATAVEKHAK